MLVRDICHALESIAPLRLAAEWDNVGLLLGSGEWDATGILLTIDTTDAVIEEAAKGGEQLIVSYHPPIFHAMKRVTDATDRQAIVLRAARAGIALYSPHTALDSAPGGVNDWLASGLGQGDVRALRMHHDLPESEQTKVVTFCPAEAVERIRNGLATVGAGRIGDYQLCSFEISGAGTFLGGEKTNPAVGERGTPQRVNEVRLEMVCPRAALGLAVVTLRQFHPYEEPPIEVYQLHARPMRSTGQGRRVILDSPVAISTLVDRIKNHLGVKRVQVAQGVWNERSGNAEKRVASQSTLASSPSTANSARRVAPPQSGMVNCIGLCAGAGGDLVDDAIDQGCQVFLTGEMRHHDVLAAQARGCTVIVAGHTNTERGYLPRLQEKLATALPGVNIRVSKRVAEILREM